MKPVITGAPMTVKLAVLDEADVMLNMGFRDDIELILQSVPKERQTVFFSATMPRPIRELIEKYSREPQNVKIEQKAMTVPTVKTRVLDVMDVRIDRFESRASGALPALGPGRRPLHALPGTMLVSKVET